MRHTTINDLAKLLKLSPSTVSRALRDHPDIRKDTKGRRRPDRSEVAAEKFLPCT
jgi:LacI family transcriptional regulator